MPKITKCLPGPQDPDLCFQRYAFDKELGKSPGLETPTDPDLTLADSRNIKRVMRDAFFEGQVLQALISGTTPGETFELIQEITEIPEGEQNDQA